MKPLASLFLLLTLSLTACQRPVPAQRPNIILIMADDLGWQDVGFNGHPEIKTPFMDALAAKGIIFDRFYSASAVCSPTRASCLTGRNPLRMNIPTANAGHLYQEEITLPELLAQRGYVSGHFGKWHLGTFSKSVRDANRGGRPELVEEYSIPTEHGYEQFFCTESKVPTFDPMLFPAHFDEGESKRYGWRAITTPDSAQSYGTAYWTGEAQAESLNLEGDDSRIIMDRVLPFLEGAVEKKHPFFASIWFHTPHLPVVSDSLHRAAYRELSLDKQLYYGTISAMDEQMGRLWKQLEAAGVAEETIIFFCSDNGPERQTPGSAGVFRERKRSLYEGGLRVPAFVVWPEQVAGGTRTSTPFVTSDYLPTLIDILEIPYPDARPLDGISMRETLEGGQQSRSEAIGFIFQSQRSWVSQQYKLYGKEPLEEFELYDLENDPAEQENLIDQQPEVAAQMKTDLFRWLNSVENSQEGMDYR